MSKQSEKPIYLIQAKGPSGWETFDEFTFDPAGRVHPKADPMLADEDTPRVKMNPMAWAQCVNRNLRHASQWRLKLKPKPKKTEVVSA